MMEKKMRNRKKRKGFTLIELIVVIAILGILAAIAIPRFSGMRENANVSAVSATLRNIQNAAEIVATQNNVLITDASITEALISDVLGITDFATDLDDNPEGAVYSWNAGGYAEITTDPNVYPDAADANYISTYNDLK